MQFIRSLFAARVVWLAILIVVVANVIVWVWVETPYREIVDTFFPVGRRGFVPGGRRPSEILQWLAPITRVLRWVAMPFRLLRSDPLLATFLWIGELVVAAVVIAGIRALRIRNAACAVAHCEEPPTAS